MVLRVKAVVAIGWLPLVTVCIRPGLVCENVLLETLSVFCAVYAADDHIYYIYNTGILRFFC